MKRDFTMSKNTQESYAFARTDDTRIAEAAAHRAFEPITEQARQHGLETEAEHQGGQRLVTVRMMLMDRLHEKLLAVGGGTQTPGRFREQAANSPSCNGNLPEIEGMLREVLTTGGSQIVERLKEYEAQIAAASCMQPEIGEWIDAHYVPLLLCALALDDEDFDAEYPGATQVSSEDRAALAAAIREHAESCPRCSLKIASDDDWNSYVNGVFGKSPHRLRIYG